MANLTSKNLGVKLDNASAAITDISGNVNSQSLTRAVTILDDTAVGDTARTTLLGLTQPVSFTLNGWVNSTLDAILGPIMAAGTSVAKTAEFQQSSGRFYNGEFHLENITYTGDVDAVQTWSATFQSVGTVNRTSKALS